MGKRVGGGGGSLGVSMSADADVEWWITAVQRRVMLVSYSSF